MTVPSSIFPRTISPLVARKITTAWQQDRNRFIFALWPRIPDAGVMHTSAPSVGHFKTTVDIGISRSVGSGSYRVHFLRCPGAELDIALDFSRVSFSGSEAVFRKFISDEIYHFRSLAKASFYASIGHQGLKRLFFWSTDPVRRSEELTRLHGTLTSGFIGKGAEALWDANEEFGKEGGFFDTVITIGVSVFFTEPEPKKDPVFKPFELEIAR